MTIESTGISNSPSFAAPHMAAYAASPKEMIADRVIHELSPM